MAKKEGKNQEKPGRSNVRNVVFILAIVILYLPMVQISLTTFIPRTDDESYNYKPIPGCPVPYAKPYEQLNDSELLAQQECDRKQQEQNLQMEEIRRQRDTLRFVVASIISFITVGIVAFIAFETVISYGLFIGAVVNILIGVMRFNVSRSLTGLGILFVLFIVSILFISKQMRKKD